MVATDIVTNQLVVSGIPVELVGELLAAYSEARHNHHLGGHRLVAVEGGRFCEAALRVLEHEVKGSYTPLGTQLKIDRLNQELANLPGGSHADSVRLHIPRTIRVIYDIRSRRDAAHLGDGIDPNAQDSSLVISCINWIMAELVRMYHDIDTGEAAVLIDNLVLRTVPVIQNFDGVPRVLRDLPASDTCLLLLYQNGSGPMTIEDLRGAVKPTMRRNLGRTLQRLDNLNHVHVADGMIWITRLGERRVEEERLADDL